MHDDRYDSIADGFINIKDGSMSVVKKQVGLVK